MITYIDTEKIEQITKELSSAINDLETEFDNLFKRFSNVPNGTKEWIGGQANYYFSRISTDKNHYDTIIKELRDICQEIKNEASSAHSYIIANNTTD